MWAITGLHEHSLDWEGVVRTKLIESYIDRLRTTFGSIKSPIEEEKLRSLYDTYDYVGMVGYIKNILHLDIRLRLGLVNKGGPDAPAWIETPMGMLMFTPAFRQSFIVTMYVRKSFLKDSTFEQLVCAIAHELCHVVLNTTGHPLRQQEEAVDLTAMLLGFRDFYVTGCHSTRKLTSDMPHDIAGYEETRSGYLTPEEVGHAAMYMTFH